MTTNRKKKQTGDPTVLSAIFDRKVYVCVSPDVEELIIIKGDDTHKLTLPTKRKKS